MRGVSSEELAPGDFAITDAHYGKTLPIYCCLHCGFKFCPGFLDAVSYYEELKDEQYETTRPQRSIQSRMLLEKIKRHVRSGSLLDIGAGSGILIAEALDMGYNALGVEPSAWLVERAKEKGLPVVKGIFPEKGGDSAYDVVALIDVIEHVNQPIALLSEISKHLCEGGIVAIVTPDVRSFASRIMGKKWWHYRVAHLGYFDKVTLSAALTRAGLQPISWHRPTWYFPLSYLLERLAVYIPFVGRFVKFSITHRIRIPLNLFDSWFVIAKKIP